MPTPDLHPSESTAVVGVRTVLTAPVRRLLLGMIGNSLGNGLVLSLLIVYLAQVRGLPTAVAGLVLSWMAVLSLVVAPLAGALIDRVGPRPVLLVALLVEATGVALFARVTDTASAFGAASLVGVAGAALWTAQSAMVASLAPPEHRQRVFGLQFMLLNLGLGIGGLVGALIIDTARPDTFVLLYLLSAASYLLYFAAILSLRGYGGPVPAEEVADDDDLGPGGYREVLADRRLRRLVLASLVMTTCGYGSLEAGMPAFVTGVAGLSPKVIGVVFAFNTGVIVVAQLLVLRRIEGHSRARVLALVGVLWAVCWVFVGASAFVGAGLAVLSLIVAASVFALGETLWSPVQPALLNDLAPPHLRGRYNAVSSVVWNVGAAIGPAFVGVMLGAGLGTAWVVTVSAGCLLAAVVALSLRHLLTAAEDGRAPAAQVPVVRGSGA